MQMLLKNANILLLTAAFSVIASLSGLAIGLGRAAESQGRSSVPPGHMLFATSLHCVSCHSNIRAPNGEDISIGWNWRATMMANAARDPYWHAGIRRETMDHPNLKAAIEDKCSTCHMPMQRLQAHAEGGNGEVFKYLGSIHSGAANVEPGAILADAADPRATLAADGVSCTVCHQIRPDNFGQEASLDGGFIVDTKKPPEEREIFGRFEVDKGRTRAMHSSAGFVPTQTDHLQRSELCASCHTLYTDAFDNEGKKVGTLPEQVPYQEWEHSDFAKSDSCQSCHMPVVAGEAPITSVLGKSHPEVPRHVFVGGNAFVLRMLKNHRDELGVIAPAEELEASAVRTEQHLANDTAAVEVKNARRADGRLDFDVTVINKAGHKLPTAYPSRRVWLHVTVKDASGATVFESGAPRADGSIAGNDNDEDGAKFEPHYTRISSADQVQIYESVMGDYAERPTTGLLFGSHYLKDNRIPPRGFDKMTAEKQIAVIGPAASDSDFVGGADSLSYSVALANARGPLTVTAELYYQAIGFRWAQNLRGYDAPEPQRFVRYFQEQAKESAKFLARATLAVN